jgi:major inositol transporter-like SP family MFS transporter
MLGLSGVPAVIMFLGLLFMPQSPRWLVSKGKVGKAKNVLRRIRNSDDIDDEISEILHTIQSECPGERRIKK